MSDRYTVTMTPEMQSGPVPNPLRNYARNKTVSTLFNKFVGRKPTDPVRIRNGLKYAEKVVDSIVALAPRTWNDVPYWKAFESIPALSLANRKWLSDQGLIPTHGHDLFVYHLQTLLAQYRDCVVEPKVPVRRFMHTMDASCLGMFTVMEVLEYYVGDRTENQVAYRDRMMADPERWSLEMVHEPGIFGDLVIACWTLAGNIQYMSQLEKFNVTADGTLIRSPERLLERAEKLEKAAAEKAAAEKAEKAEKNAVGKDAVEEVAEDTAEEGTTADGDAAADQLAREQSAALAASLQESTTGDFADATEPTAPAPTAGSPAAVPPAGSARREDDDENETGDENKIKTGAETETGDKHKTGAENKNGDKNGDGVGDGVGDGQEHEDEAEFGDFVPVERDQTAALPAPGQVPARRLRIRTWCKFW